MPGYADLHMHSNHSDGALTPTELLYKAYDAGLEIISLTDHDNVNGLDEAIEAGKKLGIEVIPGLEISSDIEDQEIHLLGYFFDYKNEELTKYLQFFRDERFQRAKRIVKKLNKIGFNISIDDVLEGAKNSAIGRPHIAEALLNRGFIKNYFEAFYKYIGDFKPAYERKIHISIQSAIKLINDAGGLSFVAHPCNMQDTLLMNLIKCGIDGIEAIHPSHNKHHIRYYSGIVNQYCLLDSGGSDFHGGRREDDDNFGKFKVPVAKVENIKKMLVTNGY